MNPWWIEVTQTISEEFSDISDPAQVTRVCVRLTVAVVLGGLLGYERETHGMSAGLRTHMLVALGSAIFVLVPLEAGITPADLSRVLQGVITGVGFLGAGAIIKLSQEQEIKGLTTAASVWLTAAIGVAAGMGRESTAILSTLFAWFILAVLRRAMANKKKSENLIQKPFREG